MKENDYKLLKVHALSQKRSINRQINYIIKSYLNVHANFENNQTNSIKRLENTFVEVDK